MNHVQPDDRKMPTSKWVKTVLDGDFVRVMFMGSMSVNRSRRSNKT
jgi:hypothetical protein